MGRRKYTDEQLALAVATSRNMREVLTSLGLCPRGGNYESVRRRAHDLNLDATHLRRGGIAHSDQEVLDAARCSRSFAQMLAKLGVKPGGGTQTALKRRVQELGIDISHFSGMAWRKGSRVPVFPRSPLEEILVIGRLTPTN